jgi:hypothetical protein
VEHPGGNCETRNEDQCPKKRPDAHADEAERHDERKGEGQIPHVHHAVAGIEAYGVFNLPERSRVVGIGMVGELLAGCPEDDIIAGAVKVAEQRKAEKNGDERKRQSSDNYERKIGEVSLTSVYGSTGTASHDGYSTFGSAAIPKVS